MKKKSTILILLAFCLNGFLQAQIPSDSLVGYWPFNGSAIDESGNGNDGTVDGAILTTDRYGIPDKAYFFDGIDDRITCGTDNMNISDKVSISVWMQAFSEDQPVIVSKYNHAEDKGYLVRLITSGDATIQGRDLNDDFCDSGSNDQSLYDGEWHHLVGTVNHDVWTIWIDGCMSHSFDTEHSTVDISNSAELTFGALSIFIGDYRYFNGSIDDVFIYNKVLTTYEIMQLYTNDSVCVETIYDTIITTLYDTNHVTVYDSIAVTDTLIIDVTIDGIAPPDNSNTIKVYPNPSNDIMYIFTGDNYQNMSDYTVKIINTLGQTIFENLINNQLFTIDVTTFGTTGLYYIHIIDDNSQIIDIRKIILE